MNKVARRENLKTKTMGDLAREGRENTIDMVMYLVVAPISALVAIKLGWLPL